MATLQERLMEIVCNRDLPADMRDTVEEAAHALRDTANPVATVVRSGTKITIEQHDTLFDVAEGCHDLIFARQPTEERYIMFAFKKSATGYTGDGNEIGPEVKFKCQCCKDTGILSERESCPYCDAAQNLL